MYIPKNKKVPKVIKSSGIFLCNILMILRRSIYNDNIIKRHAQQSRPNVRNRAQH